jgi:hypothetical protein
VKPSPSTATGIPPADTPILGHTDAITGADGSRVISSTYVRVVVPFAAVTVTVITFTPTLSVHADPLHEFGLDVSAVVAPASVVVGITVTDVVAFATVDV